MNHLALHKTAIERFRECINHNGELPPLKEAGASSFFEVCVATFLFPSYVLSKGVNSLRPTSICLT